MAACRESKGRLKFCREIIVMSFEETYPRYPFSGLVRLGIVAATFYRRVMDRREAPQEQSQALETEAVRVSRTQAA